MLGSAATGKRKTNHVILQLGSSRRGRPRCQMLTIWVHYAIKKCLTQSCSACLCAWCAWCAGLMEGLLALERACTDMDRVVARSFGGSGEGSSGV